MTPCSVLYASSGLNYSVVAMSIPCSSQLRFIVIYLVQSISSV